MNKVISLRMAKLHKHSLRMANLHEHSLGMAKLHKHSLQLSGDVSLTAARKASSKEKLPTRPLQDLYTARDTLQTPNVGSLQCLNPSAFLPDFWAF